MITQLHVELSVRGDRKVVTARYIEDGAPRSQEFVCEPGTTWVDAPGFKSFLNECASKSPIKATKAGK